VWIPVVRVLDSSLRVPLRLSVMSVPQSEDTSSALTDLTAYIIL
jgi:hypothetical protein